MNQIEQIENENLVDVIIPTYHPDEKLDALLHMLSVQTIKANRIIIMNTEEAYLAKERYAGYDNIEVHHIKKAEFDHGGTRNQGASLSNTPYILFMTQDAVPADEHLLEQLLKPMNESGVALVYARQLPTKEIGVVERYTRQFNYPAKDMLKTKKDLPELGIKTYFASNVCAMYRKEVYDALGGFVLHTIFNEDSIMASKVIGADYEIYYAAGAKVYHAHRYTYWQQFTRNFDLAVSQAQYHEIFGAIKSESEGIRLVKETAKYLIRSGRPYLLFDLILQSGAKFLGFRLGKKYDKLPKWLVLKCSMNPSYFRNAWKTNKK